MSTGAPGRRGCWHLQIWASMRSGATVIHRLLVPIHSPTGRGLRAGGREADPAARLPEVAANPICVRSCHSAPAHQWESGMVGSAKKNPATRDAPRSRPEELRLAGTRLNCGLG